jgi:RimJ/RimL family protein N-acetyltransferase
MSGKRVVLRLVREGDLPLVRRWLADRELSKFTGRRLPYGLGPGWTADPHDAQFVILLREGGRPVGICGLYGISFRERTAEVGIVLGERDTWGQGYGPEALRLLLDHASRDLGLAQISLCVHATNGRAIRAYEKVGFTVERRLTVGRWLFGRGVDLLVMTAFAPASAGTLAKGERR